MTDRDAAVTGEREAALRLAEDLIIPGRISYQSERDLARALLAEAARADALEAELVDEREAVVEYGVQLGEGVLDAAEVAEKDDPK